MRTRAAAQKAKDAEKVLLEHENEHVGAYSTGDLTMWFDVLGEAARRDGGNG